MVEGTDAEGGGETYPLRNIGNLDRLLRLTGGLAMLGWGLSGRSAGRGPRLAWLLGGAFLAAEGITGYCPVNAMLGVSTREDAPRGLAAERLRSLFDLVSAAWRRAAGGGAEGVGEAAQGAARAVAAAVQDLREAAGDAIAGVAEEASDAATRGAARLGARALRAGAQAAGRGVRRLGELAADELEDRAAAPRRARRR